MSVILWDVAAEDPVLAELSHHTEFSYGVDWSLFSDQIASCGWDCKVQVFRFDQARRAIY